MRKSKTSTTNIFLLLLFYKEKIIFCWKTYLEKLIFLHLCYCFFFLRGRLLEMQSYNIYAHIDRRRTSTQNTWQQNKYFTADFVDNGLLFLFFIYFREVPSI